MGIFGLWLLCRISNRLEHIRRNQLTPAELAAEDTAQAAEQDANSFAMESIFMGLILIMIVVLVVVPLLSLLGVLH